MRRHAVLLFALLVGTVPFASAGGPLAVGSPSYGKDAQPFTWDPAAMPIQYRVDTGPLAKLPAGGAIVDNAAGLARLQNMLSMWSSVSTATVSFQNAGGIQPTGTFTGGDVATASDFNAVYGDCKLGKQNPIIFDADGSIVSALGLPPDVIGFASPCNLDTNGHITSGFAVLNGEFQDGVSQGTNFELTTTQFDQAITHELGHFLGLDHSQINVSVLDGQLPCSLDQLAGLPLMFPIAFCQARIDAGLPVVSPDDQAWISKLYPASSYATTYGTISGVVYFSDGVTQAQGVNVIARRVDDPSTPEDESLRVAVSVVSGFLFTGNPGQSVTNNNKSGSSRGSRNPQLVGYYEIPVPAGNYTVQVESIRPYFQGGSSVGPLDPPIPNPGRDEFWDKNESAFDSPAAFDTVSVSAGQTVKGIDIILNGTPSRFDQYEDGIVAMLWQQTAPLAALKSEVAR